ncbi:protein of unknown function DUF21 [Carpediemonas membranifera]|uniref:Uncharacterized protein n=1 Tax=Carpediemonas membranifera TaxID=201153 RepID=A0A8J6E3M5_9EUKA|nr:protein of unknown function DUF21 [Carpediemonas membranifera]|eukprot:KAG9396128.1 protein of unknown function DUF21 [Carpediemonas membranifera]
MTPNIPLHIPDFHHLFAHFFDIEYKEHYSFFELPFWICCAVSVFLVSFGGLMSGLTLALLSFDTMSLQVMIDGGTRRQSKQAKKILLVVKRHHMLLVTLLLCNAAAMEALPLFLDRISSPVVAILLSVTAVLLFGEIIPQAACSRYGLLIGSLCVPIVIVLMIVTAPLSLLLGLLLDLVLGKGHSALFKRAELKELIKFHGPDIERALSNPYQALGDDEDAMPDGLTPTHTDDRPLNGDEVTIIRGALEMADKTVKDAYMPLDKVFMLPVTGRLDWDTIRSIMDSGRSRVPIYDGTRTNVIGGIVVKALVPLSPDDEVPIKSDQVTLMHLPHVPLDCPLYDILNLFQTGRSHIAVVISEADSGSTAEAVGIITLEDVIEELLQEEIEDESDLKPFSMITPVAAKLVAHRIAAKVDRSGARMPRTLVIPVAK